jgi:hypothetical protein
MVSRSFARVDFEFRVGFASGGVGFQASSRMASQAYLRFFLILSASWRLALVSQNRGVWRPEASLGLIWISECSSRRRSASFSQRRVVCLFQAYLRYMWSLIGVATLGVVTLGVGLPASCPMASLASSWLDLESWVSFSMLGVGLPSSYLMASLSSSTLNMVSCVGVATIGFRNFVYSGRLVAGVVHDYDGPPVLDNSVRLFFISLHLLCRRIYLNWNFLNIVYIYVNSCNNYVFILIIVFLLSVVFILWHVPHPWLALWSMHGM